MYKWNKIGWIYKSTLLFLVLKKFLNFYDKKLNYKKRYKQIKKQAENWGVRRGRYLLQQC